MKNWKNFIAAVIASVSVWSSGNLASLPVVEAADIPAGKVYVTGHKNPDMDSIGSAIGYSALKRVQGMDAVAVRPGVLNKEAQYALQYFHVAEPLLVTSVPEHQPMILVDHNEVGHAVAGVEKADVVEIVDHHRLGGLITSKPINVTIRPVGCTATIVTDLYEENGIDIPKDIAGVLLSAIISDTVLFKSATCTEHDRAAAEKLAAIAGVDAKKYGIAMLKAGIDFESLTPEEIVRNDSKIFDFGGHKAIIATVSTMDNHELLYKKPQITAAMREMCEQEGYDLAFLMMVNILDEATDLVFYGEPRELISKAFGHDVSGDSIYLPGVMSRKKQIVPPLTDAAIQLQQ